MKLHEDKILFADIIARAAAPPSQGGLGVRPQFIEKDYWITNALHNLSESPYTDYAVFKGGTSLSKAHNIGMRFSEDIDVAIIGADVLSAAKLKSIIRSTEKAMSRDLTEISHPQSSKGSRYRKTFYSYPPLQGSTQSLSVIPGQLLFEINSFANPVPYKQLQIHSFIYDYLSNVMAGHLIEEFGLRPFEINVLDKRTTLTEKLVALIRFSLAGNPMPELEAKIRHFYDLYYLMQDPDCDNYLHSDDFRNSFAKLLNHDRELFDNPSGWRNKSIADSPLMNNFKNLWSELKKRYESELPPLAYSPSIPKSDEIEVNMNIIFDEIKRL